MELLNQVAKEKTNFIFIGEAGSGKSEIAINFAKHLSNLKDKECHLFDMDMTKPLFRSRDLRTKIENMGIKFHYEEQFMDAPTLVGGVNRFLKDENFYVVMDIGGDHIGARSIGGFAPQLNKENTVVYYVLNSYRPWSYDIEQIDKTLGEILGVSHIKLEQLHLIDNPNLGNITTAPDIINGHSRMMEIVSPYMKVDFLCVKDDLYKEVNEQFEIQVMPIKLYLTYPWIQDVVDNK